MAKFPLKTTLSAALCILLCRLAGAVADGYVVRVESTTVYLDWGTATGVKAGDRFEVYRAGATLKHPVTGEILGREEQKRGAGSLQTVETKFSIGLLDSPTDVKAGDRTRRLALSLSAAPEPAVAASVASNLSTSLTPPMPTPQELWRSDPLDKDAVGITFADLDGDGQKDVIVAYLKKIVAYRFKDKKLEPIATFDNRKYRHWLAIDAADVKHEGHEDIFATTFMDSMSEPLVVALRFENGAFHEVAHFGGFVRAFQRADGPHLYWQNMASTRVVNFTGIYELQWEKNTYKSTKQLPLKLADDQLFGFAWGNWIKNGEESWVVLEHGERLRLNVPGSTWRSTEVYGGTKNDFSFSDDRLGVLYPRIITWRRPQSDRDQLIVVANIPDLGVRMTYLKIFRKAELFGLMWEGTDMRPAWRVSINGYVPDYGVANLLGGPQSQLWVVAEGSGGKAILLAYTLP